MQKALSTIKGVSVKASLEHVLSLKPEFSDKLDACLKDNFVFLKNRVYGVQAVRSKCPPEHFVTLLQLQICSHAHILLELDERGNFDWKAFNGNLCADTAIKLLEDF